jgi:hypothetical protein
MPTVALSPSELVQNMLVQQEGFVLPATSDQIPFVPIPGDGSTIVYADSMPDSADQAVCVYNVVGATFLRNLRTGVSPVHPGIKVVVRALDYMGYYLINTISVWMDGVEPCSTVVVGGVTHYIQSLYKISPIIPLGEEVGKKRQLWTINARIAFQDQEPPLG